MADRPKNACIVGGGPAGMMLGLLLARAGVEVVVLEKHQDFLRDFRGDTLHPSTLEVMHELELLDSLLGLPHQRIAQFRARIAGAETVMTDFTRLKTKCQFMAMMPQWDFLDFLARQAAEYPTFELKMKTAVTGLVEENGRVVGVRAANGAGEEEIRADLIVGADGRGSVVREAAGLALEDVGAPIDVLWMRLRKHAGDVEPSGITCDRGRVLAIWDRGEYWQCAFIIAKGGAEALREQGIDALRTSLAEVAPFLADRVGELRDWNDASLLTVKINRLRDWSKPGLLCIGDAAHAMSPVAGVGINLAIQDAVATANLLAAPLRDRRVAEKDVAAVQRRRDLPTKLTQRMQVMIQKQLLERVLASSERVEPPWVYRSTFLSRVRGRVIGLGFRQEHVKTPDVRRPTTS